jgi:hypothetical protein
MDVLSLTSTLNRLTTLADTLHYGAAVLKKFINDEFARLPLPIDNPWTSLQT